MPRTLTDNETRLLVLRQAISGKAWDEARWIDGRNVIVSGPDGDLLADIAIVMPATVKRGDSRNWVGAEGIGISWEEVAFRLGGGSKLFGLPTDPPRSYRAPPTGWQRGR